MIFIKKVSSQNMTKKEYKSVPIDMGSLLHLTRNRTFLYPNSIFFSNLILNSDSVFNSAPNHARFIKSREKSVFDTPESTTGAQ